MQTEQRQHKHHHHHSGCCEEKYEQSRGPELYYGYCHQSGRMRMMNHSDYVSSAQETYHNMSAAMTSILQPYTSMMQASAPQMAYQKQRDCDCGHEHKHGHAHECGCHHHHHCECCIRCADAVEYARCGEVRQIPLTFENDTRRDRDVKLTLGTFVTEGGKELNWQTALSETEFKLSPCSHKTVLLHVTVDCGNTDAAGNQVGGTVDSCQVAYATLRAEGCSIRPMVIAVAVLPNDCRSHHADCGCGCC